jgi:o-succinylbenzoate---CoA ligase
MSNALVAVAVGGTRFVEVLVEQWERGNAVFPLDPRLPRRARTALLDALRPSCVIEAHDVSALTGAISVEPGDALVVATSGTAAEPKGVVLTHRAVSASARATSARLGVDANDHWLACLPLSHVGGLSVVTRALHTGTALTVHDGFDSAAVAVSGATLVSLVPTMLQRVDASCFRTILLGGAPPPDQLPPNVVTSYGLTESGSGVVYDGTAIEGVEVAIAVGKLRHRDRGIPGHIAVRGPTLLRCYRDGTDPRDDLGWLVTSDIGEIIDGRLVVHGRADDVIITGGEKVWPDAVEAVLLGAPGVAEVAVIGAPDDTWGQRVVAVVVVAADDDCPTLEDLRAVAQATLPVAAAPRELRIVAALPRTATGKLLRRLLR